MTLHSNWHPDRTYFWKSTAGMSSRQFGKMRMVIRMRRIKIGGAVDIASILLLASCSMGMVAQAPNPQNALHVTVDHDGSYAIGIQGKDLYALKAGIAAEVDGRWLHAADYPKHSIEHSS